MHHGVNTYYRSRSRRIRKTTDRIRGIYGDAVGIIRGQRQPVARDKQGKDTQGGRLCGLPGSRRSVERRGPNPSPMLVRPAADQICEPAAGTGKRAVFFDVLSLYWGSAFS